MRLPILAASLAGAAVLVGTLAFVASDVKAAGHRLAHPEAAAAAKPAAAVADHAEAAYCTPQFKEVLKRVVDACGLVGEGDRRGCAPVDVNSFASSMCINSEFSWFANNLSTWFKTWTISFNLKQNLILIFPSTNTDKR